MIDQETLRKLREMKLTGMADAFEELLGRAPSHEMTLAELLGVLVEREWSDRDNRRLGRLLKAAKLGRDACLEDVRCDPGRGLDRAVVRDLATGRWITTKLNVIVVGKTGVGKSYLGAALAQSACRLGHRALFTRVVLDDFLLAPMSEREVHDLLEILEDRYDRSSTVITSQIPTKMWHDQLLQPTLADAICDRLVHNAHVLALDGPSLRGEKGPKGKKIKT